MIKKEIVKIISNTKQADNIFKVKFSAPKIAADAKPGQFLHIKVSNGDYPLLRRPFSINDIDGDVVSVLFHVKGVGTELFSRIEPGQFLDVLGPIGKGFTVNENAKKCLLIGGGIGIAPLPFLIRELKKVGSYVMVAYGVKSSSEIVEVANIESAADKILISSEDGETGHKGLITSLPINYSNYDQIYACGPRGLLKEIAISAGKTGVNCEVSLEEQMACGIGACLGCSCETKKGYERVCVDGPVFDARKVKW